MTRRAAFSLAPFSNGLRLVSAMPSFSLSEWIVSSSVKVPVAMTSLPPLVFMLLGSVPPAPFLCTKLFRWCGVFLGSASAGSSCDSSRVSTKDLPLPSFETSLPLNFESMRMLIAISVKFECA